jgi:hypothetical protein
MMQNISAAAHNGHIPMAFFTSPRIARLGLSRRLLGATALLAGLALAACTQIPQAPEAPSAAPKAQLQFVDLQGFDRDLAASLGAPLPKVDVAFYDRITPSDLPERLQKWMASVESSGGSVKVIPAPSSVTARSPFLLISAISSLWTANKMLKEAATAAQFKAAHAYDAEIVLKLDDKGDTVVDKVVFNPRKK